MIRTTLTLAVLKIVLLLGDAESVFPPLFAFTATSATPTRGNQTSPDALETKTVVTKAAIAGATARTGRLMVEELLSRGDQDVGAIVRETSKAKEVFPNPPDNLKIILRDLTNERQIESVLQGIGAGAIWCATGS
jgi:hypothetical protein